MYYYDSTICYFWLMQGPRPVTRIVVLRDIACALSAIISRIRTMSFFQLQARKLSAKAQTSNDYTLHMPSLPGLLHFDMLW
jgi:hypothetical protein